MITMLFCLVIFLFSLLRFTQSSETKLIENIRNNVSSTTRPVLNSTSSVKVTLGFELVHIVAVVESEQTIKAKVWLRMEWVNEMMRWNPDEWSNIKKIHLDNNKIWTPDLFLKEDVSEDVSSGPTKYKTKITCHSNGTQQWLVPTLLMSSCQFNIKYFPYDRQKCYLRFVSWTHSEKELDLQIDTRPIVTSNYIKSLEWSLVSVTSERSVRKYSCCPDPFVEILFTLTIDRRAMYYIYNALIPCIIQMIMILFTFLLPAASGERIGVVITVLLVFAVYLEIVSGRLPKSSSSIPTLSLFYISAMGISSCSLIATCTVLVIYFKGSEQGATRIPGWARKLLHGKIGNIFGVRDNIKVCSCNDSLLTRDANGNDNLAILQNNSSKCNIADTKEAGSEYDIPAISRLIDEVRVITKVIQDQEESDAIEKEWQMLAKLLDRVFFFVFLFMYIVITLATVIFGKKGTPFSND